MNSSGGIAVPQLLEALGAEVVPIHCEPNGDFPHNPEPLAHHLTDLSEAVVAHQVACEGLRVEDGVQVLIANDPDTYCQQIQRLVNDETLRQKIEKNARKHAEDFFSFSSIGKQLADHFDSLNR